MSTMSDAQLLSLVRPLLRPTEAAVVSVQGVVPANALSDEYSAEAAGNEQDRRRVLAIITSGGPSGTEEGSVFTYKRKDTGELTVVSVLPITHDLVVSVAQATASAADVERDRRQSQMGKGPGRFLLTLKSPSRDREVVLLSSSPSLKDFLAECRRLKASAEAELSSQAPWNKTHHLTTSHAWLEYYEHQLLNYSLSTFGSSDDSRPGSSQGSDNGIPDHLFHPQSLHIPLQKRLSPASAGLPPTEDDATADLILLRDEWVRKQLNIEREKSTPGSSVINLRICSYNVNGQTPPTVQDARRALGNWIRTQRPGQVRAGTLPPSPQPENAPSETSSITAVSTASAETLATHPPRSTTLPSPAKLADEPVAIPDIVRTESPGPAEPHSSADEPDLLVVGFQELDLSAEALLYSTNPAKEDAWTAAIMESLGKRSDGDEYIKVASKQLVGMLIILFATKSVRPRIRDVRTSSAGVGIMGLMGNKGAVALRVRVDGSTLTFVNSHLAAFEEMHDKRNADWREIARKLVFLPIGISDVAHASAATAEPVFVPPTPAAAASTDSVPGLQTAGNTPAVDSDNPMFEPSAVAASTASGAVPAIEHVRLLEKATIWDCDCLFWSGDLNYRIDLPDQDVRELLGDVFHPTDKHNLKTLLKWDQLKASQRAGKAFDGFEEAEIHFLPTYRFDFGTKADQNGYDIKRKPAWTDRILRVQSDAIKVSQSSYSAHPELLLSDHKPISSSFELETDCMSAVAREILLQTLLRRISNWILSDDRPRVRLSAQNIDFGDVAYDSAVSQSLEIKNIGKAPCGFRFVPPTEDAAVCENWLSIEPQWGIILPGESEIVRLTIRITAANAAPLNSGKRRLEDTLVIHTLRGKDHFVAIGGNYKATCFANDLQWLARLPCSVREYASSLAGRELLPEGQASNAPNEVMRLVAWLMSNGLDKEDLFLSQGNPEISMVVHEALDTGESFEDRVTEKDSQSVADVLLLLLDSLPEPVIPWSVQAQCTQVLGRDEAFELLSDLPAVNRNVWVSLCAFLHFLVQHAGAEDAVRHRWTRALAAVFAPILMRDNLDTTAVSPVGKRAFLLYFIED